MRCDMNRRSDEATKRRKGGQLAAAAAALVMAGGALADRINLINGDQINGRIVNRTDSHITVEHSVLGDLSIPIDHIESLQISAELDPGAEARLTMIQEAIEKADAWKGRVEIGAGLSAGVTDEQSAHIGATMSRETDRNITRLDALYYYSASDGDRTNSRFTSGVRHDWLMPNSKWFYFSQGRYDYDEFQSWEHRLSGHGGAGYHLIDEEDFDLKLRGGLGLIREFGSENEDVRPEAVLGIDVVWQLTEKQKFIAAVELFPDLSETGEFRTVTDAGWSVLMDEATNMSLRVGLHHEYESTTDAGIDHNDLRLTAGLQFDF